MFQSSEILYLLDSAQGLFTLEGNISRRVYGKLREKTRPAVLGCLELPLRWAHRAAARTKRPCRPGVARPLALYNMSSRQPVRAVKAVSPTGAPGQDFTWFRLSIVRTQRRNHGANSSGSPHDGFAEAYGFRNLNCSLAHPNVNRCLCWGWFAPPVADDK